MTPDERLALRTLAALGGEASLGPADSQMDPTWAPVLAALVSAGRVTAYPENGTVSDDPGRTIYALEN